jgi:hypothetical protein
MNPITETEKAEWGKLCETATPEPWWNESGVLHAKNPGVWTEDNQSCIHPAACPETYWLNGNVAQQAKDADFIAAARTALPRLLAEVERLAKELAEEPKPATVTLQVSREWEIKAWALRDALRRRKYEQPAGRSSAETLAEYLLSEALAGVRKEGGA